jgi:uncharacterized protein (TIGR03000 family)
MPRTAFAFAAVFALAGWSAAPAQQPAAKSDEKPANLTVKLPRKDATVTIMGEKTQTKDKEVREFVSPPLKPNTKYEYTVVATWSPNNYTTIVRTRVVEVRAGGDFEVDMTKADPAHPDEAKVRFVPTPDDIVSEMIKLGKVGPNDVVYDIGCGDGRMVIAGVKEGKAKRGVGIDLDPQRIRESKANAKKAGVEDKVEFREGDALKIKDLSDATVVLLYMGNEFNMLLRPILLSTLKPGTRVVSHRFTMGDWKPDQTIKVIGKDDGDEYLIHLWTVPEPKK